MQGTKRVVLQGQVLSYQHVRMGLADRQLSPRVQMSEKALTLRSGLFCFGTRIF